MGTDLLLVGEPLVRRAKTDQRSRTWTQFTGIFFLETVYYGSFMARDSNIGSAERHRLDVALDAASVAREDLDAARRVLLDRLFRRSDDFPATAALQALNTYSAGERYDAPSDAPARVQRAGLSSLEQLRRPKPRAS
jgi:hypothetical protein